VIVLDTHALMWWVSADKQLSAKAKRAIDKEIGNRGKVLVSAISAWEITMLIDRGRLVFTMEIEDWLAAVAAIDCVEFVSVDVNLGVQSVRLPGIFHPDPADRLIVALARHYSASLITADKKIQRYKHVKTIW
jgi:PIN domain nuclease of toxin-antitoxin system